METGRLQMQMCDEVVPEWGGPQPRPGVLTRRGGGHGTPRTAGKGQGLRGLPAPPTAAQELPCPHLCSALLAQVEKSTPPSTGEAAASPAMRHRPHVPHGPLVRGWVSAPTSKEDGCLERGSKRGKIHLRRETWSPRVPTCPLLNPQNLCTKPYQGKRSSRT